MSTKHRWAWGALIAMALCLGLSGLAWAQAAADAVVLTGQVVDAHGPVAGATVRVHTTSNRTLTDAAGAFTLTQVVAGQVTTVTAWAGGYFIGWSTGVPGGEPVTITIAKYHTTDNYAYDWAESHTESHTASGSATCGTCHPSYAEWRRDAHSQSAVNPRFISLYRGADVNGNRSPLPPKNNLGETLPPDLAQPYYGPGFKLDFPNRDGNCATCHTPLAGKIANATNCGWSGCHAATTSEFASNVLDPGVSPLDLSGDAAEGISCEFCHKTGDVYINRKTGLPYEDSPGILSMRLFRPKEGEEVFFGTLDDVVIADKPVTSDTYLPLMQESAFCAGCHHGVMGGVVGKSEVTGGVLIYSSYSEWLNSPYSDPESGRTCQDCHMPEAAADGYVVNPRQGGVLRDRSQIHNHTMPGATDLELMQNAVTLTATAVITAGQLHVEVAITNDQTGHHVPTDSPLRHLILAVNVVDAGGKTIALAEGPVLPEWTGDYAGQPGRAFAKLLRDEWTGETPTAAYWRPVAIVEDNRLAAFATDVTDYAFDAPRGKALTVEVQLIYRRAYQQLMAWKGWTDPDIVMEEQTLRVPAAR
jgi:hypothetical protein